MAVFDARERRDYERELLAARRAALASVVLIPFGRPSSQTFWVSLSVNDRITRQC